MVQAEPHPKSLPNHSGSSTSNNVRAPVCNLYSITTNQAAIIALFRVINRYVGNLPPMPGVFPVYPVPVIRNTDTGTEMVTMRCGMPSPPRMGSAPVTNVRNTSSPHSASPSFTHCL